MDALRSGLRAVGEHVAQVRQLRIAVLLDEPGDVVAAAPAAGLALDREGRDAEVGALAAALFPVWGACHMRSRQGLP
jgi:hypothetical protein